VGQTIITKDNTPTLTGLTPMIGEEVYISYTENGKPYAFTTMADSTGKWTYTFSSPLDDGSYGVLVQVQNGRAFQTIDTIALTVDTVPPAQPVITGATDAVGAGYRADYAGQFDR